MHLTRRRRRVQTEKNKQIRKTRIERVSVKKANKVEENQIQQENSHTAYTEENELKQLCNLAI